MIFATGWLSLHLFGVFITFALLVIVSQKEDATYKSELLLTIACCLVTLVAKSIYIGWFQTNASYHRKTRISRKIFCQLLRTDVYSPLAEH